VLEKFHEQIDQLKTGAQRSCDNCGKIYDSVHFPYKHQDICLYCYEKIHNKTLHTHRAKFSYTFGKNSQVKIGTQYELQLKTDKNKIIHKNTNTNPKCPSREDKMQKKGFHGSKQRYICMNCKKNWTEGEDDHKENLKSPLADKKEEIEKAKKNQLSIQMKYKGLTRTIFPYAYNETYCVGYCNYRNELRTFRIDKMQNIKIGDKFEFQETLKKQAESNINNVQSYSSYRRY
jgi:transposase-like protein